MRHFNQSVTEQRIVQHVLDAQNSLNQARDLADKHDDQLRKGGSFIPVVYESGVIRYVDKAVQELAVELGNAKFGERPGELEKEEVAT